MQIQAHRSDLFPYLLSLRVFPGTPNWAMNITFPHLKIPDHYVIFSVLIGLIPWNFIVCEAGVIISTFTSKDEVIQPSTYVGVSVLIHTF